MSDPHFDESLWFEHVDGYRLYPWLRDSRKRGRKGFWVSDGSNLIEDAEPVASVEALIHEVFGRRRSVWLRPRRTSLPGGLYRLGERAIRGWGAAPAVKPLVEVASRGAGEVADEPSGDLSVRARHAVSPEALLAAMHAALSRLAGTERDAVVKQRVGQYLFRDALLHLWADSCAVSALDMPELLRASHAKPWAQCADDRERLDPFNGLLLAPHLDVLFDRGYVTFDEQGNALWSQEVAPGVPASLGLADPNLALRWIDPRHAPYLQYHRAHVFRDTGRVAEAALLLPKG